MLVGSKEALGRLHSSDNLMNRLDKRRSAMGLFGIGGQVSAGTAISLPGSANVLPIPVPPAFVNPFEKSTPESTALAKSDSASSAALPVSDSNKEPQLDSLVGNADTQIKLAQAHDEALGALVDAVKEVRLRIPEIKAEKLPGVIAATSKVVDQIQRQRIDATKSRGDQQVHLHFYTPVQKAREDYEVIDVN